MNKRDFKLLEAIFGADIDGRAPYQSRNKQYKRLEAEGLCQIVQITLPGRFPVTMTGWELTEKGHMEYCMDCENHLTEDEIDALMADQAAWLEAQKQANEG